MKRLRRKIASLIVKAFKDKRRRRRILLAEWVSGDINDPNIVQQITDVMANGGQIQIEYNGEWKTVEPYGWNSSKAGNILLMCYKDTGEIRSYRLDRITNIQFDSDTIDLQQYGFDQADEIDTSSEIPSEIDGVEVPTLDENNELNVQDQNQQEESPFDGAIDILEQVDDQYKIEDLRTVGIEDYQPVDINQYDSTNQQETQNDIDNQNFNQNEQQLNAI